MFVIDLRESNLDKHMEVKHNLVKTTLMGRKDHALFAEAASKRGE